MARSKNEIVWTGDSAQLIQDLEKLKGKYAQLEDKVKRAGKAGSKSGGEMKLAWSQVGAAVATVAGALGVGGGIQGAVSKIVEGVQKWKEYQDAIARGLVRTGQEMTAIAMSQDKNVRARVLHSAQVGAEHGLTMGESWGVVQRFQAREGSFEGGMRSARAAFRLAQKADVPLEGAAKAVSVGRGLGLTADQAARAAYAAGKASQLSPAELAQMAGQGLPAYSGIGGGAVTGYGVAAALSGLISDPGNLATYTRQVGTLMQQRTGQVGRTWQRLGFDKPGQDLVAQLKALEGAGITTMGDLQAAGFAKKESLGLSILLKDLPQALEAMEKTKRIYGQQGILAADRARAEAAMPEMAFSRKYAANKARLEIAKDFGPGTREAMEHTLWRQRLGIRFREEGQGWFTNDEGMPGWLDKFVGSYFNLEGRTSPFGGLPRSGAAPQGDPLARFESAADKLDRAGSKLDRASGALDIRSKVHLRDVSGGG